jgi:hypothetical protein
MIDINAYENSEEIPEPDQYPNTAWAPGPGRTDKYGAAFDIAEDDQERADIHLWMLVGYSLRYDVCQILEDNRIIGQRKLKWREAFETEREALAWRAFAKDIGDFELYSTVDGKRIERTKHRDLVWKLFKARLPKRVAGAPNDILERAHIKREKSAKSKGESYWRKGHAPTPEQPQQQPAQEALFQ